MEYIKYFDTQDEFIDKKGDLPFPCVSYIEETKQVEYNTNNYIKAKLVFDSNTISYLRNNGYEEVSIYSNDINSVKEYRLDGVTYTFEENKYETIEKNVVIEEHDFYGFVSSIDSAINLDELTSATIWHTESNVSFNDYLILCEYRDDNTVQHMQITKISDYESNKYFKFSSDLSSCSLLSSVFNFVGSSSKKISVAYVNSDSLFKTENGELLFISKPSYETTVQHKILLNEEISFNGDITISLPEKEKEYTLEILLNEGAEKIGCYGLDLYKHFFYIYENGNILTEIDLMNLDKNSFYSSIQSFMYSKISTIEIPENLTFIYNDFYNCSKTLTSITVNENNPIYDSRENCNAIIQGDTLLVGCQETIIPETIKIIYEGAFMHCEKLTSIIIPDSVTIIDYSAFSSCGLTSVTFGKSVEYMNPSAFQGCPLKELIFKSNIAPRIGVEAFSEISSSGTLYYPKGSDYTSVIALLPSGWTSVEIEI